MSTGFDPRGLEVSVWASGKAPTPMADWALEDWWEFITGPELESATAKARELARDETAAALAVVQAEDGRGEFSLVDAQHWLTTARSARSRQKNAAFVSVTCGGTFERRLKPDVLARRQALPPDHKDHLPAGTRGHLTWTGLVPLDFDGMLTRAEREDLFDELVDDRAIAFVYHSPSGQGIKAFVAVDPVPADYDEHVYAAEAMFAVYQQATRDAKGGKDAHRLSYGAHDPDAFIADWVEPRRWRRPKREPKAAPPPVVERPELGAYTRAARDNALADLRESTVGNRHDAAMRSAMSLVGFVKAGEIDDATARRDWQAVFDAVKPDQQPTEADDMWRHAHENTEQAVVPQGRERRTATNEAARHTARQRRRREGGVDYGNRRRRVGRRSAPNSYDEHDFGKPHDPPPAEPEVEPEAAPAPQGGAQTLEEQQAAYLTSPKRAALLERYQAAVEALREHPSWCEACYWRARQGRCDEHVWRGEAA